MDIGPRKIIEFSNGFYITETVFFGLLVAGAIIFVALWSVRNLKRDPKGAQIFAELVVETTYKMVGQTMGKHNLSFAPYIGTLFLFIMVGNSIGMLGVRPMTADVNMTFALAMMTFILIQYNAVRTRGAKGYVSHLAEPYAFMFPIKIVEEVSFPVSLGFRLFGNILGGYIIMILLGQGLAWISEEALHLPFPLLEAVIPLPFNLFFDAFEPVLQSFIFTMLTMVFIKKGMKHPDEVH